MNLTNKHILLGVCGSIAAYKSPDIVRRLQDLGAHVRVVLSEGGQEFITPLSLATVSKHEVYKNLWEHNMEHISLAKWADIVLIAPISANSIATLARGNATDLLSNIILALPNSTSDATPVYIAPAMNKEMFSSQVVSENIALLQDRGVRIIESAQGEQACGDVGKGRMQEPETIAQLIAQDFHSQLAGKQIVITLGATIEKIDPVRYISNFSSGKMGVALANACLQVGANVTLVYGNISVDLPTQSTNIQALSADEMLARVQEQTMDVFISCAAVSDYKVATIEDEKIKKSAETLTLNLVKNVDILATVAQQDNRPLCVGFAAETTQLIAHAKEKLHAKHLDMIVANTIVDGFGGDTNTVVVIDHTTQTQIEQQSKIQIAEKIIQLIEHRYATK